jgi:hypothetical protein
VTAALAAGAALTVVTGLIVRQYPALAGLQPLGLYAVAWAVFAAGAWLVLRVPARRALPVILLGALAIQVAAVTAPSAGSDDLYRYVWDGRVQLAGIDPYRYPPDAPQLAGLREPFLWPASGPYCVGQPAPPPLSAPPGASVVPPPQVPPGCTQINRPRVHTIYPPVAQAYFTAVSAIAVGVAGPGGAGTLPIQAAGALLALATTVLLAAGLSRLGRDPRLAVLWAWCPVTDLQSGNGAHVDTLAVFLTAAALLVLARPGRRRRALGGGVLLGLAIATKITPVLAAPAVLRRRPVTVAAAIGGATATVYLPHLLAVGGAVIGFLPGYLAQDGYATGDRFKLLSLVLPGPAAAVAAVAVLAIVGLAVTRWTDPDRPWRGALIMTGAALAVTTPALLWYSMLLVMLVVLDGRAEWLALAAARYLTPTHPMRSLPGLTLPWADQIGYAAALAVIAAVSLIRLARRRRDRRVTAVPAPAIPVPALPEAAQPEPAIPVPALPEAARPESAIPVPALPEAAQPEPAQPGPALPEPAHPEPALPAVRERAPSPVG